MSPTSFPHPPATQQGARSKRMIDARGGINEEDFTPRGDIRDDIPRLPRASSESLPTKTIASTEDSRARGTNSPIDDGDDDDVLCEACVFLEL